MTPLRVLIVCRATEGSARLGEAKAPFINEQVTDLRKLGLDVECHFVLGGGLTGYLRAIFALRRRLRLERFDLLHAHYSLSAIVALCQRWHPVIVTFHGSDVNTSWLRPFAYLAAAGADWSIV